MWILQVEVADLVMSPIVAEGKHTNNLNDLNNTGNESRQRGDVYDSKKRRWNEGASAFDAPMNGAKRQRW